MNSEVDREDTSNTSDETIKRPSTQDEESPIHSDIQNKLDEPPVKSDEGVCLPHSSNSPNNNNDSPTIPPSASKHEVPQDSSETSSKTNQELTSNKQEAPELSDKKKENDKLSIYKALAIKLKKELVKCRSELEKCKEDSEKESNDYKRKVVELEETLNSERQTSSTTISTLEASLKTLKVRLESAESDLQLLHNEFESYKVRASQIMHQNNPLQSQSNRTIEEQRYNQLKELNETQSRYISNIELRLTASLERNKELESESKRFQEQLSTCQEKLESLQNLNISYETLSRENETLKLALKQFRTKLKEPAITSNTLLSCDNVQKDIYDLNTPECLIEETKMPYINTLTKTVKEDNITNSTTVIPNCENNLTGVSPSTSIKDESQTASSSSYDGSTSGYVHIKPATFEIISRSSVLEEAQNQIDNLTKAYLDSENTNSLLSEQVHALKEEIRRLQLITERIELADNLEYLKNVVFKFISLESNQTQQKQRLVPVLSTVLKLLPEETAKLNSIANAEKTSMASSFFKLG